MDRLWIQEGLLQTTFHPLQPMHLKLCKKTPTPMDQRLIFVIHKLLVLSDMTLLEV